MVEGRCYMWTKELPTKSGFYWVLMNADGMTMQAVVPVDKIGENGELGVSTDDGMLEFASEEIQSIKYWHGPIDIPEVTEEIKAELGEIEVLR